MHIVPSYIESVFSPASNPVILLHESKRENGRIKKFLANQSSSPDDHVNVFKLLLKRETACRRIEQDTFSSELQRRDFELLGNS